MMMNFRMAWRNLWRHRRRTWLTTAAMVFSNSLLVFMISLQYGTYDMMINNTLSVLSGHVQVQAPAYHDDPRMRYSIADITPLAGQLRGQLHSDKVAARASTFALASSAQRSYGIQLIGVEPQFEPGVSTLPGLVKQGRFFRDSSAAEIIVGSVLARNMKVSVGDELTLLGSGLDGSFAAGVVTVVGVFESGMADIDRSFAEIPLAYFQDVFSMAGQGHSIVIRADGLEQVAAVKAAVEGFTAQRQNLAVLDWDALQPGLKQAIQADISSAWFMYMVLVSLVAFSVLNTQLMSVLERTREFGIIMALGLKPGRLGRLVLLETALMAGLGLVLGVLLGGLLTLWVGQVGFAYPGMEEMAGKFNLPGRMYPQLNGLTLLLGPTVVFIACMLAALYPAARLHFMQPVQAMRAV